MCMSSMQYCVLIVQMQKCIGCFKSGYRALQNLERKSQCKLWIMIVIK